MTDPKWPDGIEDTLAAREDRGEVDSRPQLIVHAAHNPDPTRIYYEIPDALMVRVCPPGDRRSFIEALADLLGAS